MSFQPDQISNLKAWWRADKPGSNYQHLDHVSSLADQSGNGNDLSQSALARQPVYHSTADPGFPYIDFTSRSEEWMETSGSVDLKNALTIVVFARLNEVGDHIFLRQGDPGASSTDFRFIFEKDDETAQPKFSANDPSSRSYVHGIEEPVYFRQYHMWAITVPTDNESDASLYLNGQPITTQIGNKTDNLIPDAAHVLSMGLGRTYVSSTGSTVKGGHLDMNMVETMIYRQSLSSTQIGRIWEYLQDKYLPHLFSPNMQDYRGLRSWTRGEELASNYSEGDDVSTWLPPSDTGFSFLTARSGDEPSFRRVLSPEVPAARFESGDQMDLDRQIDNRDKPMSAVALHRADVPEGSATRYRIFQISGGNRHFEFFHRYTKNGLRKMILIGDNGLRVESPLLPRQENGFNLSGVLIPNNQRDEIKFAENGRIFTPNVVDSGAGDLIFSDYLDFKLGGDYVGDWSSFLVYKDDLSDGQISSLWAYWKKHYLSHVLSLSTSVTAGATSSALVYTFKANASLTATASTSNTASAIKRFSPSSNVSASASAVHGRIRGVSSSVSSSASTTIVAHLNTKFIRASLSATASTSNTVSHLEGVTASPTVTASTTATVSEEHGVSASPTVRAIWNKQWFTSSNSVSITTSNTTSSIFYAAPVLSSSGSTSANAGAIFRVGGSASASVSASADAEIV